MTNDVATSAGKAIIKALGLKLNNNRINIDGGDKTPAGLSRTLLRYINEAGDTAQAREAIT